MDIEVFTYSIIFFLLIGLSSFFSGSEVAFFSIKTHEIEKLRERKSYFSQRIISLLKTPSRLLITILICNTIVNVSAAVIAAFLTLKLINYFNFNEVLLVFFEILLVTIIILLIGEITPKIIAKKYSLTFAHYAALPISLIVWSFFPLSKLFELITNTFRCLFKLKKVNDEISADELAQLGKIIENQSNIDKATRKLFQNIGELFDLSVKEIAIPRVHMIALDINAAPEKVKNIFQMNKLSYTPIYENNIDNIIGVIYLKDTLNYFKDGFNKFKIINHLQKPLYVPETKLVTEMLKDFQSTGIHIAIIVDEHGGTVGMITLKDILNSLVKYFNIDYLGSIKEVDENTIVVGGLTQIKDVEERFDTKLKADNSEISTMGGFIYQIANKIPEKGEKFIYKDLEFFIENIENNRIKKIRIVRLS